MNPLLVFKAFSGINPLDMGLMMKDWKVLVRCQFLQAAFESGLLRELEKPATRSELLDHLLVARPEVLDALLEVGLSCGELSKQGDHFRLAGRRARLLARDKGEPLAAILQCSNTYYNDIYCQAPARLRGQANGDYLSYVGDLVARAARLTEPFVNQFVKKLVSARNKPRILEIGCGSGGHLREARLANSGVYGLGIDMDPGVVALAQQNMELWGLTQTFEILEADILSPGPELDGSFDLITLYNLVYYFTDDERQTLFKYLATRLNPNGIVAVANNFKSQGKDLGAANLNMATTCITGCHPLPSVETVTEQLIQAGLTKVVRHRLMPGSAFYGLIAASD
jgi:2-polyprenyl-3-methyl-5-hydroxy-6-metoxy-1,4-benzoquinol methylase